MVRLSNERWLPRLTKMRAEFAEERESAKASPANNQMLIREGLVNDSFNFLVMDFHFQDYAAARATAQSLLIDAIDAIEGDWRKKESDDDFRQFFGWAMLVEAGWVAALLVEDETAIKKLARYIDSPLVVHLGYDPSYDRNDDMVDFNKALAQLMLKGKCDLRADWPMKCKRPPQGLLLLRNCILALAERNVARFTETLVQYVSHYVKREKEKGVVRQEICCYGTILYHFGQKFLGESIPLKELLSAKEMEVIAELPKGPTREAEPSKSKKPRRTK